MPQCNNHNSRVQKQVRLQKTLKKKEYLIADIFFIIFLRKTLCVAQHMCGQRNRRPALPPRNTILFFVPRWRWPVSGQHGKLLNMRRLPISPLAPERLP